MNTQTSRSRGKHTMQMAVHDSRGRFVGWRMAPPGRANGARRPDPHAAAMPALVHATKRWPWLVRADNRRRNKRARADNRARLMRARGRR